MLWKNLAPEILRQRLIIEGLTDQLVMTEQIKDYLNQLSKVTSMEVLSPPFVYPAKDIGYGAWIHWATSGSHFYTYNKVKPHLFTVDVYTCKPFSNESAVEFTKEFFKPLETVWKEA